MLSAHPGCVFLSIQFTGSQLALCARSWLLSLSPCQGTEVRCTLLCGTWWRRYGLLSVGWLRDVGTVCFECIRVVCGGVCCAVSQLSWWGMLKNQTYGLWFCVNSKNCSQSGINVLMEQENLGKTLKRLFTNCLKTLQRVATRRALLCSLPYL